MVAAFDHKMTTARLDFAKTPRPPSLRFTSVLDIIYVGLTRESTPQYAPA